MVIQFLVFLFVYMLLLLVTLAEEFKRCPPYLQHLCCWIHETKSIRNLLTLVAITINFGVASCDIVSAKIGSFLGPNYLNDLKKKKLNLFFCCTVVV